MTQRKKGERHRAVPVMPEIRHWRASGLEVREQNQTDELVITGQPIVFNTPYTVHDAFGSFRETMAPGVARDVLAAGADVRFLLNHDGLPLARSTSGTLSLSESSGSVDFTARLDARQQLSNDLAIAISRGDVSAMSCAFVVASDQWDAREENRTIHQFRELLDVSAVTYPASPQTTIAIAQRMALEIPVESRARLRKLIVEMREGKTLTATDRALVTAMLGRSDAVPPASGRTAANLSRKLGRFDSKASKKTRDLQRMRLEVHKRKRRGR